MNHGATAVDGILNAGSSHRASEATEAQLYRIIMENTVDVIVRGGSNRKRTYVSPSCREVLGYTPLELLGHSGYALVHPHDRPTVERAFAALSADRDRCECIFRMLRKDGRYIWIEGRYRFLSSDGSILAVLRDISRRKEAEQVAASVTAQLEFVNAMFAQTLDHMIQGVCFFDGNQRLLLSNRRYAELYGLAPEIVRAGMTLEEIVALRYAANTGLEMSSAEYLAWRQGVSRVLQPEESEIELRNGRLIRICHYPMEGGGWVATHEDLTQRRRSQQMLQQAQKLEAVGRLAGGVAHCFNNSLQIIGMALEEANSSAGAAQGVHSFMPDLLAQAVAAVAHGAQLTQQLLAFSRKQLLRPSVVDLARVIEEVSDVLREACSAGMRLELQTQGGPFHCLIDSSQFDYALLNLATNAAAAMPDGGALTVALTHVTGDDAEGGAHTPRTFVRVDVRDEGQGIPPEALAHVFEPFFTVKGEGEGLGLAQVYGFALQCGGSVSIASTVGAGTTVSLLLPAFGTDK